jgi:hypothetical protein
MSGADDKIKHSKRLLKDQNAIVKQTNILKAYHIPTDQPHKYAKRHALNCGDPKCILCSNPRKIFKEKTIQERRFDQDVGDE